MTQTRLTLTTSALALACLLSAGCASKAQKIAKYEASAKSYMDQQRYPEAIIQFRNATALDPQSADLEISLADAYTRNQQYQDAFTAYKKALQLAPNNAKAQLSLGQFYLLGKDYALATASAQAVLKNDPENAEATILLSNIDTAQQKFGPATQRLEAFVQAHDGSVPAHLSLGILYAAARRTDQAREQFQRAITLDPKSAAARSDLANLYATQGDWKGSEQVFRDDVAQNPDSVQAAQALAGFLAGRRRYSEAEPLFQKLVTMQHNSPQARFALASFYLASGQPKKAVALDQQLAQQAPTLTAARVQWAEIAAGNKDFPQAESVINALLKDQPNDVPALLLKARVQLSEGQPDNALTTLTAAQRLNPNLAAVVYEEGEAYAMKSDAARSKDSFLQAARLDPKNYQVQAALASLMQAEGDYSAALSYAQTMQALLPNLADGYFVAGNAYAAQQQYGAAVTNFRHALQLSPGYSAASTGLGMVYVQQKQWKAAEDIFHRALQSNPADASALGGLMAVYQSDGQASRILPAVQQQLAAAEAAHAPAAALAQLDAQLARAYAQQKNNAQAEASLKQSLQLDPHNFNTYAMLGTLYAQQNETEKARDQYALAAAQNPSSSGLWTMLGLLDESVDKKADAEQAYLKAVALDPNNGVADNNLAVIYTSQPDKIEQALVLAQRAKRALPTVAAINDTLGWIYTTQGVYQLAIPILQQAAQSDTGTQTPPQKLQSAQILLHLATALYRSGQKQQARVQLDRALQLDKGLAQQADIQQMLKN